MKNYPLLLPALFLLLFAGCNGGGSANRGDSTVNEGAYNPPAEKVDPPALPGTVYHFNELIDASTCNLRDQHDSLGWDLLFINDSQFVDVFFFPSDLTISKGRYRWENDSIRLDFDSLRVVRTYAKVTSTADELMKGQELKKQYVTPYNERSTASKRTEKLSLRKCDNGAVYLAWHNLTLTQLLPEDNGVKLPGTAEEYVKKLKADGVWELLMK